MTICRGSIVSDLTCVMTIKRLYVGLWVGVSDVTVLYSNV